MLHLLGRDVARMPPRKEEEFGSRALGIEF